MTLGYNRKLDRKGGMQCGDDIASAGGVLQVTRDGRDAVALVVQGDCDVGDWGKGVRALTIAGMQPGQESTATQRVTVDMSECVGVPVGQEC